MPMPGKSAPFWRPPLDEILGGLRFAIVRNYAPRGTHDGPLNEAA